MVLFIVVQGGGGTEHTGDEKMDSLLLHFVVGQQQVQGFSSVIELVSIAAWLAAVFFGTPSAARDL